MLDGVERSDHDERVGVQTVRKALIDFGKKPGCSQEKARALLKQYGHVDTLKALKPEHFKAVIDAAGA